MSGSRRALDSPKEQTFPSAPAYEQAAYHRQSSLISLAFAGVVENATIEPMVAKPPNSNAVHIKKVFMAISPMAIS